MKKILLFTLLLLQFCGLNAQKTNQKWLVNTVQGSNLYAQSWATRTEFPKEFIREQWAEGKQITSIGYGGGLWAAVLSKGSSFQKQTWILRSEFPKATIQEKWQEGYAITHAAFGEGAWAFVFSQESQLGPQTYQWSSEFPKEFIEEHWTKGYHINQVLYGQKKWWVSMSKSDSRKQTFIKSRGFPKEWIKEQLAADFEIKTTAFGDGYWIVVASKEQSYDCTINTNPGFPKSEVSLAWSKEKAIINLAYGPIFGENLNLQIIPEPIIANTNFINDLPEKNIGPRLHLLAAMDTRDRFLGQGAQAALQVIQDQFSAAAKSIGYDYKASVLAGEDFQKNNLESTLGDLEIRDTDILVFYYFGHGFRYTNHATRFPSCFVGKNGIDHPDQAAYALTDIYKTLVDKKARLTLVFAECCNNEIGIPAPIDNYVASRPMSVNFASKDRYKALFLGNTGSILLASSDQGQASWATSTGGYFLDSFMDAFQYQVSTGNTKPVSWNSLLEDTKLRVKKVAGSKNRIQEPIFTIQIQ